MPAGLDVNETNILLWAGGIQVARLAADKGKLSLQFFRVQKFLQLLEAGAHHLQRQEVQLSQPARLCICFIGSHRLHAVPYLHLCG